MARKDCDSLISRPGVMERESSLGATATLLAIFLVSTAGAATVRMWPSGVVDGDQILVEHVAQVQDVVPALANTYTSVSIKPAPQPVRKRKSPSTSSEKHSPGQGLTRPNSRFVVPPGARW